MPRVGAGAAFAGVVLLIVGTILHPGGADPNDPVAAFTEYAADRFWVVSHLTQLAGAALILSALIVLSRIISDERTSIWADLGMVGAGSSLSLAGGLQAVDGIALKVMVDQWAAAPAAEKMMIFHAAFGVRQVEVGLAAISSVMFGATAIVFGVGLALYRHSPRWLGWPAIAGGIATIISGIVIAYSGFSLAGMTVNMSGSLVLMAWTVAVAVWMWRRG